MRSPPAADGIDVVVPARRPATVDRLLSALAQGDRRPDLVSLVGHEVPRAIDRHGLQVRLLRPRSERYAIGDHDVALRRNVGGWASPHRWLVFLDDDVVPARDTLSTCARLLPGEPVVWGHHRFADLVATPVDSLLDLLPRAGRPREDGVNRWHLWMSCYGGMLAIRREVLLAHGGYDMAYAGRHAGEDQDLGRRLARSLGDTDRVFIHEPPFAWHPLEPEPWAPPGWSNLCRRAHDETTGMEGGVAVVRCGRCPWFRVAGEPPIGLSPLIPFDPDLVDLQTCVL